MSQILTTTFTISSIQSAIPTSPCRHHFEDHNSVLQFTASYGCLHGMCHVHRPYKLCGVMRHSTNIWITAADRGRGGGISFPRRRRGNWDIIQTNNPLTQASVSVYVGEVRVSIPFRLASVVYSVSTIGRGYLDESHEDRANIMYIAMNGH